MPDSNFRLLCSDTACKYKVKELETGNITIPRRINPIAKQEYI